MPQRTPRGPKSASGPRRPDAAGRRSGANRPDGGKRPDAKRADGKRVDGKRADGARAAALTRPDGKPTRAAQRSAASAAFRAPSPANAKPKPNANAGGRATLVEKSVALAAKPLPALPGKAAGVQAIPVRDAEEGLRLDRWFKERFPALAFGHLQKLCRTGQIRVDGARAKTATRLSAGMVVRVPPLKDETAGADEGDEGVSAPAVKPSSASDKDAEFLRGITLYEDRDVLVLNKPFGLAVQGGSGTTRHVDGMLAALTDRSGQKPRLVHRIDKDTSGVLVTAKTRLAASELARTFRSRAARKVYWALTPGVPRVRQGRISTYLAKGEGDGPEGERMQVAEHGDRGATHALTYYAVVDHAGHKMCWLSLKPVTGRTHQLRAHAAHIGHPIVGDPKYFRIENWELPGGIQNRLHLLARRLVLPLPSGDMLDVSAPLPPHMQQSWNLLGFDAGDYDPIIDAPED